MQFLKGMSEKIKQGIEAAQTDLVKEKALKEQEEVSPPNGAHQARKLFFL